jgi:2-dehydropantoate 2-reductase
LGKRIAMVGSGAVGGYVAGNMVRNGADVTLIDAWPDHVTKMNESGLELRGTTEAESHNVPVKAINICEVSNLPKEGPIDIAFISVKSYETQFAAALIESYLAPDGYVVSLQNAINEEAIAAVVGAHRVIGCIASSISCGLEGPALVRRHVPIRGDSYTVFRAGELHGRVTDRVQEVAELAGHTDSSMVTKNIWGERWTKLVINSSHNGLSACTGLGGNDMVRDDGARSVNIRLTAETLRVGKALGFVVGTKKGTTAEQWYAAAGGDKKALQEIEDGLFAEIANRSDGARPSMGQDMLKGRKTEIDAMNGFVCEKGAEVGIPTPMNATMVDLVKRCERGELTPDPSNVASI